MTHIREGARSLARLIMNLLDISKSEEGKLAARLGAVELGPLACEVQTALELRARIAGVTLECEGALPAVHADADLLRRVLENLTENAIRHAPVGSTVRLTAREAEAAIELRVTDAGPGVPPELRDRLFERFATRGGPGTGLGLHIVRELARSLGGEVTYLPEQNAFKVRLPRVAARP